jgi:adenylosuccinate synthase
VLTNSTGVVHVPSFFKELETLKNKGLKTDERIFISDRGEHVNAIISTLHC